MPGTRIAVFWLSINLLGRDHGDWKFSLLRGFFKYRYISREKQAGSIIIPEIGASEANPDTGII